MFSDKSEQKSYTVFLFFPFVLQNHLLVKEFPLFFCALVCAVSPPLTILFGRARLRAEMNPIEKKNEDEGPFRTPCTSSE